MSTPTATATGTEVAHDVEKRRRKFEFPSAFTILFALTILAVIATWFVPAGSYSKLVYQPSEHALTLTEPGGGHSETLPATQDSLDKLGVKIGIEQFTSGAIAKPISVPGSYQSLPQNPAHAQDVPLTMVHGTMEAIDVIVFILVLGGLIGVVRLSGAFESGLVALTKKTKGREFALIFLVAVLMALGGAFCGMEEEAVAFYPILVPVFLALGYDSIVCVGAIFLASSIGTAFAFVNPFSVVIASNAAGIPFTEGMWWRVGGLIVAMVFVLSYLWWYSKKVKENPEFSYTFEDREKFAHRYSQEGSEDGPFTWRKKLILVLFVAAFVLMVVGVMKLGWWFPTMAASFLTITIVIMFIVASDRKHGASEKQLVDAFSEGAASLVGVSLIIGLARGINAIMEKGMISDSLLNTSSHLVQGMSGPLFVIVMLFVFFFLGFIVPSSSGLAVLSMPIMAPLADSVGLPRFIIVCAYQWGQYAMLFLAPTGLVMATLQMLDMKYSHWLRFIWPVVAFVLVFAGILLVAQVVVYT